MINEYAPIEYDVDDTSMPRIDRTVTQVTLSEDGWTLEVEDDAGVRLTYWIADPGWAPHSGTTARFYHRDRDKRLCALEIDGHVVFDACQ